MPGFDSAALVADTGRGQVAQPLNRFPDWDEMIEAWARLAPAFAPDHQPTWRIRQPKG